jgi:hypothetical protein
MTKQNPKQDSPTSAELAAAETPEPTEAEYSAAAAWAKTATIDPRSPTLAVGKKAEAIGRALLRAARPGRPQLDPAGEPGQESPVRRVRLPVSLNKQLDDYVAVRRQRGERTTPSDVVREALAEYLRTHRAS